MQTLKFTIENEEQSKEIQDAIFALDGGWSIKGSNDISQEYQHLDKPFLHIESTYVFDAYGNITDQKYFSLMYENLNEHQENIADHVPAHVARRISSDFSFATLVTLDNFKSHLNKIQ